MQHAVIMAGGSGTRLWPLSREGRPKQLLRLFGGKSLLRIAFERLNGLMPPEQIYVITSRQQLPAIAAELPELPAANLLGEPCPRDTAPAVGLAAHLVAQRDPNGTMGVFTADHIIQPIDQFRESVAKAYAAAERYPDVLVTFGIKPTGPHTGYGYIHRGRRLDADVFEINAFKEKPDLLTAGMYVASGEYFWNSGMFVWRIPTILAQYARHQPEMNRELAAVAAEYAEESRAKAVLERFSRLQKISVDFAIMEKADRVAVIEMPCRWLDVGSWTSLAEIFPADDAGNVLAAPNVATLGAGKNIFVSETGHLIAAVGVDDLIVVHSPDATLVCRKQDAQRIKELVQKLERPEPPSE
ncbi:MAG TPA: mannose-1-phosphate guanylyltransferase [Phycisphaerae bacterium]|nr:mannose-1-phosphate guanylyltransferase [Phycisphaerae bacterium]HOJ72546.1 mannose-1-phosphate guanylyltransferase [Phycisphaerae bacterium]HOM49793.1 mannose-1-phosphate guanylyltransferase [Phycisphaerae bacterium]HOQ84239.1 mannose-1-phosphate guanylyltransferase [Phycisphaerae bacterium]HPP25162.1 mannose-1-phosphate guanylyltransferase [Phycisphaerae bacterium]